jgi:hydroxyacylglutathione hydrolase
MIYHHFMLDVPNLETNAFVIGCEETREAMVIDVGIFDARIPAFVEEQGLKLTTVFITHGHGDHVNGLQALVDQFSPKIYSYAGEVGGCTTQKVAHGDTVSIGNLEGRVVHTPGHTPDGVSLIFPGHVFTGDALFSGSVGGTSNLDDYELQLSHIREHLFTLPGDYEIHVGHGPSSTIAVERDHSPFF